MLVAQAPRTAPKCTRGRLGVPPPGKRKLAPKPGKPAGRPQRPPNRTASKADSLNLMPPVPGKPNVGRVGSAPPPASKDRLRPLSKLGDVAIGDHAAQSTPAPQLHSPPRAPVEKTPRLPSAEQAAEKYVIEREQKRCNGFDIPKHSRYNFGKEMSVAFGGIRQIDGQALVLLKVSEEIFVMPVDESTARRLRRIPLGQQIAVQAQGAIKTKGRSR